MENWVFGEGKKVKMKEGFTLVELMIVLAIIAIIAAFAIPNLMKSRMSANETGAIGVLRTLVTAESTYMNRYSVYGNLQELFSEELIPSSVRDGEKNGYFYGEISTDSRFAYCFGAVPIDDGRSGSNEYSCTGAGTVYQANLSSSKNSAGTDWTAGAGGIPSEFTTAPQRSSSWTPVGG